MSFDVETVRAEFPALAEVYEGRPAVFFDNPGGTQVHGSVIEMMQDSMVRRNSNIGGAFVTTRRAGEVVDEAHRAVADLLGCAADEVVFGNNMTSLTFHVSRSLAREWEPGDEIVVTRLDHDANVAPWVLAARDVGAVIRRVDIDPNTCSLDLAELDRILGPRTRLVAIGYASNATGEINDVKHVVDRAREAGALSFVDAVQYAPHGLIDVRALGCDFLACSAYKFFGPHTGQLYGRREHLERLAPYKVRPASDACPDRWETGTQNHEGMAGTTAAIEYLAGLGQRFGGAPGEASRRERLAVGWRVIGVHERGLAARLLEGLQAIPGMRIFGPANLERRVATFSVRKEGRQPSTLAAALAKRNVFCWDGHFYALELAERTGVEALGGFLRIGLAHYNTIAEVDSCLEILESA